MAVLVFVENTEGHIAKNGYEAVYYAAQLGEGEVIALTFGKVDDAAAAGLGAYGAAKTVVASAIENMDPQRLSRFIRAKVEEHGANTVVFAHDPAGKMVAPRISAGLKAGFVTGVTALPEDGYFRKNVFSGKAYAFEKVNTDKKVVSVLPNSLKPVKAEGNAEVVTDSADYGASGVEVKEVRKASGDTVPLPEAELVVSAGRGLKGPENWGMIEELAGELGATTACSRPVADIGWRPHHEHVGQTGIAIRPNLYIAVGISGAIQHLAGVNGSKTIVVINTDEEAPFFKAADYGIVGDAFEVVPRLIESVKRFKAQNN